MKPIRFLLLLLVSATIFAGANRASAFYDPSTGRWLSKDPIGERGGVNLYGMVKNNPIVNFDPLGLWAKTVTNGVWADSIPDKIPVKNGCGEITIPNAYIDASLEESLQGSQPDAYSAMTGAAVNGISTLNTAKINMSSFVGAGFSATYKKSDNCPCCDHFWWEQEVVGTFWNSHDYTVNGNTAMDFTGDNYSPFFNTNRTDKFKLNFYCGAGANKKDKRLLKTINWSRKIIINNNSYPGSATVTLEINW